MIEVAIDFPQDVIRGFVGERIGVPAELLEPSVGAAVLQDKQADWGRGFPQLPRSGERELV